MKQVLAFPLALLIAAPGSAQALGLGELQRKSALNQPFNATIELIGPQADEIDNLTVRLADTERFQRAGIERAAILSQLRFEVVQTPQGSDYIKITSPEAIKEPFLDFLLEVNWANGRIYREYTVLLDPPTYSVPERPVKRRPNIAAQSPVYSGASESHVVPEATFVRRSELKPAKHSVPNQYGPVRANEGLWGIARRVRPERDISVQQMMIGLFRANPEAFLDGNINALKKGVILQIPSSEELHKTTQGEALNEIKRQIGEWQRLRTGGAGALRNRREEVAPQARTDQRPPQQSTDGELKVIAPTTNAPHPVPGSLNTPATGEETKPAGKDLTLAQEALDSQRLENADLKTKLNDSDETVKLLQQQIALKNAELAALQAKFGSAGTLDPSNKKDVETVDSTHTAPVVPSASPAVPTQTVLPSEKAETRLPATLAPTLAAPTNNAEKATSNGWTDVFEAVPGGIFTVAGTVLTLVVGALFGLKRRRPADDDIYDFEVVDEVEMKPQVNDVQNLLPERITPVIPLDKTHPQERVEVNEPRLEVEEAAKAPKSRVNTQQMGFENDTTLGLSGELRDDPLAEVNVYLAYEQFEQAEALVQEAIRTHPQDHTFKLRLLEVYYSAGNARAYESYARLFRDAVGSNSPLWESVVAMWNELSPGRALFDVTGNVTPQPSTAQVNKFVDITDLASADGLVEDTQDRNRESQDLDFDLSIVDLSAGTEPNDASEVLDLTAVSPHGPAGLEVVDLSDLSLTDVERTGFIDLSAENASDQLTGDIVDISGGLDPLERTLDDRVHSKALSQTLDFSFDLETGTASNDLLDIAPKSTSVELNEEVLDLTAPASKESPRGDGRTTVSLQDKASDDAESISTPPNIIVASMNAENEDVRSVNEPRRTISSLPVMDFVPSTFGQDLTPVDSTLTNLHEVPDIDFSLSTGAIVGTPGLAAANNDLTPIDDEQKPFEEITWSFEDAPEDEAQMHLNTANAATDLELKLEQDPSTLEPDFLDIFGNAASPIEDLAGGGQADLNALEALAPDVEQRRFDDVDAKLSLAKTYLELGDLNGASSMLDEVDSEGSSTQKAEASKLRHRLNS